MRDGSLNPGRVISNVRWPQWRELACVGAAQYNFSIAEVAHTARVAQMKHAIDAIYENGTFRPIQRDAVAIADGQRVRITVDDQCEPEALRLAMSVYDGLADKDIDEIEQIARDRSNFFGIRIAE